VVAVVAAAMAVVVVVATVVAVVVILVAMGKFQSAFAHIRAQRAASHSEA
jgi:hypothetical protein